MGDTRPPEEVVEEAAAEATHVLNDATVGLSGLALNGAEPRDKEALAQGLFHLFRPAVDEIDSRVKAVRQSQVELRAHIDNLAEDLRRISDSRIVPVDLDPYVKKLVNTRRRVVVVSNLLQTVQERVNKINYYVNREKVKRKKTIEDATLRTIQGADEAASGALDSGERKPENPDSAAEAESGEIGEDSR